MVSCLWWSFLCLHCPSIRTFMMNQRLRIQTFWIQAVYFLPFFLPCSFVSIGRSDSVPLWYQCDLLPSHTSSPLWSQRKPTQSRTYNNLNFQEFKKIQHRHMGWGRGQRGLKPYQNLGSKRNLGKANFYRALHVCVWVLFFSKRDVFNFKVILAWY